MSKEVIRDLPRQPRRQRNLEWLMYLPGAVIISYGFWLTLTA